MRQTLWAMAVAAGVVLAASTAQAQGPTQKVEPAVIPLKVTVVITRHKSDKAQTVVSRLPFEVWVNTGSTATVRFDSSVPVPATTFTAAEEAGKAPAPVTTFSYRTMGTSLTVEARALDDGRFSIPVSIEDSQIVPAPAQSDIVGGPRTATQNLRTSASPILRDGQTVQHSLATDRISGDITKVEITLTVVR